MKRIAVLLLALVFVLGAFPVCAEGEDDKLTIVSFGDSITASGVWQKEIDAELGTSIINLGVGGINSNDGVNRLSLLFAKNPDVVIIFFGANDSALDMAKGTPIAKFRDNMRFMLKECLNRDIKVIAVMQSYFEAAPYYTRHKESAFAAVGGIEAYMDTYIEAYREIATEMGVKIADVRSMCDAYAVRSEILADGVHPNNKGYSLYAKAVGDALVDMYLGDGDGDGEITAEDYIIIKRHILGTLDISPRSTRFIDVNGDERIGAIDYVMVKRMVLGTYKRGSAK